MSKNYVIAIGGTGSRVVESLVHMCAMGWGPKDLGIIIVDPDQANGNKSHTESLIAQYRSVRKNMGYDPESGTAFYTDIVVSERKYVYNIFSEEVAPTLSRYVSYYGSDSDIKNLTDLLFTEEEKETTLNEGFRGHPNIGSVILSDKLSDDHLFDTSPWKEFREHMSGGEVPGRVMVVGSVFGGTGAAGIPTFGNKKILKERAEFSANGRSNLLVGTTLVLPYFAVRKKPDFTGMCVDSDDFPLATKAALDYYFSTKDKLGFDAMYLLGFPNHPAGYEFAVGNTAQKNEPHFIELFSALTVTDFFSNQTIRPNDGNVTERHWIHYTGQKDPAGNEPVVSTELENRMGIAHLPIGVNYDGTKTEEFQKIFYKLFLKHTCQSLMVSNDGVAKIDKNQAFYREVNKKVDKNHYFESPASESSASLLKEYFKYFNDWLFSLHRDDLNFNLINKEILKDEVFDKNLFENKKDKMEGYFFDKIGVLDGSKLIQAFNNSLDQVGNTKGNAYWRFFQLTDFVLDKNIKG